MMGEIRLWVPIGTKRLTVRHPGVIPLSGYSIPMRLEPKATYRASIELVEKSAAGSDIHFFGGLGYNVMSISGPSAAIGLNLNHHVVEVGAVYGLNKSDDLYFYNSSGNVSAARSYQAFRVSGRYGFEAMVSDAVSVTPQVGVAYNALNGKSVAGAPSGSSYKTASSVSVLGAVRLAVKLSGLSGCRSRRNMTSV